MANHNLRLIHSAEADNARNIVGVIHRSSQISEDRNRNLTRRYSKIDNAIVGLTKFMFKYGYVGDVCEVYHHISGLQICTIKMTSKGNLKTNWILEN